MNRDCHLLISGFVGFGSGFIGHRTEDPLISEFGFLLIDLRIRRFWFRFCWSMISVFVSTGSGFVSFGYGFIILKFSEFLIMLQTV